MIVKGEFIRAGKAAKYAACIDINKSSGRVKLTVNTVSYDYLISDLRLSLPLGTLPDSVFFPDGSCFTAPRGVSLRDQIGVSKDKGWLVHRLENNKAAFLFFFTGIILSFFIYLRVVVPGVSLIIADVIPDDFSLYLGQHSLTILDDEHFSESRLPPEKQQKITDLFQSVIPDRVSQERLPLKLLFRHSDSGANAFTLADGTIIITDDLIKLTEHDDELAAVLLHEIGHHYHRHIMHSLVESSFTAITFMWLTGDINGAEETLISSVGTLFSLSYSRSMETEADAFAVKEMKNQHRSLNRMVSVFNKLADSSETSGISFLSTHPDWKNRIDAIGKPE